MVRVNLMQECSIDFFRGTINATYERCICLESKLNNVKVPPVLDEYLLNLKTNLSTIKSKLYELLQDPNLGHEFLINQQYSRYYRLSQHLSILESYPITVLSRYNDDDFYFYNIIRILCKDINYPYRNPLVSTYCMTYYASELNTELLIVPFIDRNFLLDLPFILHELGHIILQKNEEEILNNFIQDLRAYITDEKNRVGEEDRSPEYIDLFNDLKIVWEESWIKEFASDLIATYLLGPSYGWSYFKLCSRFSKDIYRPGTLDDVSSEHPSHEVRMRTIIEALKELNVDISKLEQHWKEYTGSIKETPPQEYEYCYPDNLLKSLAKNIIVGCKNIGLRSFNEHDISKSELNLVNLINTSFEKFLEDSSNYREWEIGQIKDINDKVVNFDN